MVLVVKYPKDPVPPRLGLHVAHDTLVDLAMTPQPACILRNYPFACAHHTTIPLPVIFTESYFLAQKNLCESVRPHQKTIYKHPSHLGIWQWFPTNLTYNNFEGILNHISAQGFWGVSTSKIPSFVEGKYIIPSQSLSRYCWQKKSCTSEKSIGHLSIFIVLFRKVFVYPKGREFSNRL